MASVAGVSSSNPITPTDQSSKAPAVATDPLANQSTFLTLLVSQLKNQNPTSPMDGTTFVTQLAQFSDLQQSLAIRQDMDLVSNKYAGTNSQTPDPSSGTGASGQTNNQ